MQLSERSNYLNGQEMFKILAKCKELEKQGREIIHFEIGDPDYNTPENIKQATIKAINDNNTHYCSSSGLLELKEKAADVTLKSRGFKPDIDQILVTAGANVQLFYAMACTLNQGDEIIIPDPAFVSYYSIAEYLGLKIRRLPLCEIDNFQVNPKTLLQVISNNTKMIIINSPSNPCGSVINKRWIEEIYSIVRNYDLWLLSDEVYARMIYNYENFYSPSSIDQCKERVILVNGFSKSYAMTGFRLGVMTAPKKLIEKCTLLLETTSSCVSPFIQMAGIEALSGSQNEIFDMMDSYNDRRIIMWNILNECKNISCNLPDGTFYMWVNIQKTGLSSQGFSDRLLISKGVAVTPGNYFGNNGEGFIRLAYCNSVSNIQKGCNLIKKFCEEIYVRRYKCLL